MKLISRLIGFFVDQESLPMDEESQAQWLRDPLSHPALARMSMVELADLPLPRGPARPRTTGSCR